MNWRKILHVGALAATVTMTALHGLATASGDGQTITLPQSAGGGKPLMACLKERRTNRNLGRDDLDLPTMGNLLWAAWGINRSDGKHVIPTALNRRQIMVFAVRGDGVWQYLPQEHSMKRVLDGDRRSRFDGAGLVLLYAAPAEDCFAAMHVGSMYQNVGLYCASAGLANCVKYQKHDVLDAELPLPKGWKTYITQSVAKPSR